MAGTVTYAKLENATSREKLKPGRTGRITKWRQLDLEKKVAGISRAHLGYQRWKGDPEGRWVLRTYHAGRYSITPLGLADDAKEADGKNVLKWEQATAQARELVGIPPDKPDPDKFTVAQAMKLYTEHKESEGQPTRDLIWRTDAHIIPALGDKLVAELASADIRKWLASLAKSRAMLRSKKGGRQNQKPKATDEEGVRRRRSSANRVLTMLKAALNFAYDEGHVSSNAEWGRRVKPFENVDAARVRYLKIAEAQRLINACDPDFRPLVQAALQTGARYSELARLQVHDFNSDSGTVTIRRSKSGKTRHVILTEEGAAFFRQAVAGQPGSAHIFLRNDGNTWEHAHQGRPMREACEAAKIDPPISFHGLRHTWASLSVMAGMPLMVVAKNLGHADTRMVEKHYGHLAPLVHYRRNPGERASLRL